MNLWTYSSCLGSGTKNIQRTRARYWEVPHAQIFPRSWPTHDHPRAVLGPNVHKKTPDPPLQQSCLCTRIAKSACRWIINRGVEGQQGFDYCTTVNALTQTSAGDRKTATYANLQLRRVAGNIFGAERGTGFDAQQQWCPLLRPCKATKEAHAAVPAYLHPQQDTRLGKGARRRPLLVPCRETDVSTVSATWDLNEDNRQPPRSQVLEPSKFDENRPTYCIQ